MAALRRGCVIMICGYRKHGKNTLFDRLCGKNECQFSVPEEAQHLLALPPNVPINEIAFARVLKEKVAKRLKMPIEDVDRLKDQPIPAHTTTDAYAFRLVNPENPHCVTVRDVLIDVAAHKRSKDVDYFAKIAAESQYDPDAINFVTDFRYPNEYSYFASFIPSERLFTIRVHRHGAEVPVDSIVSEHSLDAFKPNFLITSTMA